MWEKGPIDAAPNVGGGAVSSEVLTPKGPVQGWYVTHSCLLTADNHQSIGGRL